MPTPRDTASINARLSKNLQSDGELKHQPNTEMSEMLLLKYKKSPFLGISSMFTEITFCSFYWEPRCINIILSV